MISERIAALDTDLFAYVDSQTSEDDQKTLLAIQDGVAEQTRSFSYLEIGSHLGGTLQAVLADPRCTRVVSIDPNGSPTTVLRCKAGSTQTTAPRGCSSCSKECRTQTSRSWRRSRTVPRTSHPAGSRGQTSASSTASTPTGRRCATLGSAGQSCRAPVLSRFTTSTSWSGRYLISCARLHGRTARTAFRRGCSWSSSAECRRCSTGLRFAHACSVRVAAGLAPTGLRLMRRWSRSTCAVVEGGGSDEIRAHTYQRSGVIGPPRQGAVVV